MARVSKKVSAAQREAENAPHRVWKTAIYARLSDFDDVLRNTESLEVQISYVKEYINHRDDLMLLDVFADKRCTGTNFDRPEYSSFRCCWKQMAWRQEKTISLKDGMMPRKMQLSFRLKQMNKVPSRLKSVQLDITSIWSYNTSKWT